MKFHVIGLTDSDKYYLDTVDNITDLFDLIIIHKDFPGDICQEIREFALTANSGDTYKYRNTIVIAFLPS